MLIEDAISYLRGKNFALIDCEYIQTTSLHQCVRSMYILCKNGFTCKYTEFYACKRYRELEAKHKTTFRYCHKRIHHLSYEPKQKKSPSCVKAKDILHHFINTNNIQIMLYKGGIIEQRLCNEVGIPSLHLEFLGVPKVSSHDPRIELHNHYDYLLNIGCLFPIPNVVNWNHNDVIFLVKEKGITCIKKKIRIISLQGQRVGGGYQVRWKTHIRRRTNWNLYNLFCKTNYLIGKEVITTYYLNVFSAYKIVKYITVLVAGIGWGPVSNPLFPIFSLLHFLLLLRPV